MGARHQTRVARSVQFPRASPRLLGHRQAWRSCPSKALARVVGWSIVLRGIYMGSLILGATRQDSMGYTFIGAALNALRMSISGDAETIGVSKKGQIFFVAFPLLVALGSFATLEPSELLSP